eukprot:6236508-Prymnesium_polylepis.2
MKQALEGELPHRSDTPMVDVRGTYLVAAAAPVLRGARRACPQDAPRRMADVAPLARRLRRRAHCGGRDARRGGQALPHVDRARCHAREAAAAPARRVPAVCDRRRRHARRPVRLAATLLRQECESELATPRAS